MISKNLTSNRLFGKELIRSLLPKRISRHRILGGPLKGRMIYTSWHDYPRAILGWAETDLVKWLMDNVQPGETWLDVGAYHGYTAIAMSNSVGKSGRVFAFEPDLTAASALYQTKLANGLSQIVILPFALGENHSIKFLQGSTFRGMFQTEQGFSPENTSTSQFVTTALDYIWESIADKNLNISGVKLDVQGFEISVLRGMKMLLKTHRPKLIVEVHKGVDREELLQTLEECGYSRKAIPIEPMPDENNAMFYDDRNYEFFGQPENS